jgi:hypothetical protein
MNYYNTLIEVADDCRVAAAQVPEPRGARRTKATVEYELLANKPIGTPNRTSPLRCTQSCMTSRALPGKRDAKRS